MGVGGINEPVDIAAIAFQNAKVVRHSDPYAREQMHCLALGSGTMSSSEKFRFVTLPA